MTLLALCALALLPALGGCGEDASRQGEGETAPPPREAPQAISEADSGSSFTLPLGSETTLRLSGDYLWSEPSVRGEAAELVRVDYFQDPGFSEWTVLAVRAGTATIATVGRLPCPREEDCPEPPLHFRVTIAVE